MQKCKPVVVPDIVKQKGEKKIVVLTAYDFTMARLLDKAADILLVGDTLGCVVQGHGNTLSVTLEQMIYHAATVSRGAERALVVGDLPFGSYQEGPQRALQSAVRLVKEASVGAVKLEGGESVCAAIQQITAAGIPVVAHLGLTPQSFHILGGNRVQGKSAREAQKLIRDAKAVERAGAFALVLEAIPSSLAREVTRAISIPTIGIGAGPDCDGQVLVINDMIGFNQSKAPMKFNKEYCAVRELIEDAVQRYAAEVRNGAFPAPEHGYAAASEPPVRAAASH